MYTCTAINFVISDFNHIFSQCDYVNNKIKIIFILQIAWIKTN
ncbi:hypothetical protein PROVRUST_05167 [Providencia rustigianii DSM 4541]|uniref:Uncharacterized protein n=1 Tax=Providencia rustigianii DSM 4541 TaxID=500637 RepID=D1NY45_9GAMM|nr:hypothetical protein PROVRUST_05167 [Providencia rustigianii DSM 4541]